MGRWSLAMEEFPFLRKFYFSCCFLQTWVISIVPYILQEKNVGKNDIEIHVCIIFEWILIPFVDLLKRYKLPLFVSMFKTLRNTHPGNKVSIVHSHVFSYRVAVFCLIIAFMQLESCLIWHNQELKIELALFWSLGTCCLEPCSAKKSRFNRHFSG